MGRIKVFLTAAICAVMMMISCVYASADSSSADKQRITVQDKLPDFTVYCEEYDHNVDTFGDIYVQIYSSGKEIATKRTYADTFQSENGGEGITYFLLIDTSRSMNYYEDESFASIKEAIINFTETQMDSKDKVFLLPFDEKKAYDDKIGINPTTSELKEEINKLNANGRRSNIYDAIGGAVKIAERIENDSQYPSRKVALLFTDACEFNDGGDEATEADVEMVSAGVSLHAFTIGKNKEEKNELRKFVVRSGGRVFDGDLSNDLDELQRILDETLVVKTSVKNPSDLVGNYSINVYQGDLHIGEKTNISAPNTSGIKDDISVTVKKKVMQYWWILLIIAIAVIAAIVLVVIRRNKGVVDVNGKVVYGKNLHRKYHVRVKEHDSRELTINVSVKGGPPAQHQVIIVQSLIVGRANICDLYFDDEKMSRQHFAIEMLNGELYISDLNSTGGTYLNGVKVYMKQKLTSGDIITAGTTRIVIEW